MNLSLIIRTTLVCNSNRTPQDAFDELEESYPERFRSLKWLFYYQYSVGWDNEEEVWAFIDTNNKICLIERGYTDKGEWENFYQYSFEEEEIINLRNVRRYAELFEYVFNNKSNEVSEEIEQKKFLETVNNYSTELEWIVKNQYQFCYVDDFDRDVTIKVPNLINNNDKFTAVGALYYNNGWAPDLFYRVRTS